MILRSIGKIIRGLSHHHGLSSKLCDDQQFADLQKFDVPDLILPRLTWGTTNLNVVAYAHTKISDEPGISSFWILRFFERTNFLAIVYDSPEAMAAANRRSG